MTKKFYVIETEYVGPNQDQHIDDDVIRIQAEPERGNMSNEIVLDGWCGTTNDWAVYAHGSYDTEQEAEDFIRRDFGDVRDVTNDVISGPNVMAVFKQGIYTPMSRSESWDWIYNDIENEITADTTDDDLKIFLSDCESSANSEGLTLNIDIDDLKRYQTELD